MSLKSITPNPDSCLVEAYLPSKAFGDDLKKRTGLLYQTKHDKKTSFEGIPNRGYIYALPADYDGPNKIGQQIVFDDNSPQGFKWNGKTLFPIKLEAIAAIISE